jgi:DNA replication protein DnaC
MQRSTSGEGLAALVAQAHAAAQAAAEAELSRALAAGFDSVAAWHAHRGELERLRAEAQTRAAREAHARLVLEQVGSRVSDDVARRLVAGEGLDDTPAHVAVRDWLASDRPTLVLSGGTGVGKTVAAVRAMMTRTRVQFIRALRIGAHFERWASDRESNVVALDLGADLLVVDDLGQEPIEDRRAMPAIEEVLDSRQSERTRTLITTNLDADAIRDRYSERIRSRLAQNAKLFAVPGDDRRRVRR